MKTIIAAVLFGAAALYAEEAAIEWNMVPEPVNGYIVRYGPSTNNLLASQFVGNTNSALIVNLPRQKIFAAVQAVGIDGMLSDLSNIIALYPTNKPSAPTNLRQIVTVTTYEVITTNIINIITNTVILPQ